MKPNTITSLTYSHISFPYTLPPQGLRSASLQVSKNFKNISQASQLSMLRPYFYKPYSTQRKYNTSHTKFPMVSSDGFPTIDWCLVTTFNISKQAWGNILNVKSPENSDLDNFETGVLVSLLDYEGYKLIHVGIGEIENGTRQLKDDEILVVLPFDLDKSTTIVHLSTSWWIVCYLMICDSVLLGVERLSRSIPQLYYSSNKEDTKYVFNFIKNCSKFIRSHGSPDSDTKPLKSPRAGWV
ncbi:hypothetical protein WICPIJ_001581 [Wickerhamomyces pijperi]|uniref:Uncharacterized protein n=1 Tax=Wickerhamomyces pijperi TaxID=599730 RepID=A0A9P8QDA3_WICPI|nr:hypothetical protein WICPIJ_001581 [Wickerhamomyces pijperi]